VNPLDAWKVKSRGEAPRFYPMEKVRVEKKRADQIRRQSMQYVVAVAGT
jgi:hypothetical protein